MLNFYSASMILIYLIFFVSLEFIYLFKITEFSYFTNILNKLVLDEFYFWNLCYIWSNFYFMFILFYMVFTLLFSFKTLLLLQKYYFFVSFILINLYLNLLEYFFLSSYDFDNEFFLKNYNILLNNNINKIHPMLLYISIYFLYTIFLTTKFYTTNKHTSFNVFKTVYNSLNVSLVLSVTLFLGGWWAFQEGSWGGWWDWDVSEVFGLSILISLLKLIHSQQQNYDCTPRNHFHIIQFLNLLFFYFFMQLNFSLISHNFNLQNSSNFISNVFYIIIMFFIVIIRITILFKLFQFTFFSIVTCKTTYTSNFYFSFKFLFFSTVSFIVLSSTFSIFSNWLWMNLSISYSVGLLNFHEMVVFLMLYISVYYFSFEMYYFLFFVLFTYNGVFTIILIFCKLLIKPTYILHYFIFLSVVVNSIYHYLESSFWSHYDYGFNCGLYLFYNLLKLDSPFVNTTKDSLNLYLSRGKNFNWWYEFSILDFKMFDLSYSVFNIFQTFIYDSEINNFVTHVSGFVENPVVIMLFFSFIIYYRTKVLSTTIVF